MSVDYNILIEILCETKKILKEPSSKEIENEISMMIQALTSFELEHDTLPIREFLIRTNTATAQFLLSDSPRKNIIGVDAYISYENVVASYLNAIVSGDSKMANKIEPLLKGRIEGFIGDFKDKYDYNLLLYISEFGDLQAFLKGRINKKIVTKTVYPSDTAYNEYVIYEEGEVHIKTVNIGSTLKKRIRKR